MERLNEEERINLASLALCNTDKEGFNDINYRILIEYILKSPKHAAYVITHMKSIVSLDNYYIDKLIKCAFSSKSEKRKLISTVSTMTNLSSKYYMLINSLEKNDVLVWLEKNTADRFLRYSEASYGYKHLNDDKKEIIESYKLMNTLKQ